MFPPKSDLRMDIRTDISNYRVASLLIRSYLLKTKSQKWVTLPLHCTMGQGKVLSAGPHRLKTRFLVLLRTNLTARYGFVMYALHPLWGSILFSEYKEYRKCCSKYNFQSVLKTF